MKSYIIFFLITFVFNASQAQSEYGFEKKISFILGGGFSVTPLKIYKDPVINLTNNSVAIEEASPLKPNLTLGISYTPVVVEIERTVKEVDSQGNIIMKNIVGYDTRGISIALFFNPISISTISEVSISNTIDLGIGIGYKHDNFSIFVTGEFYSIRQPRKYFVAQFKDKNLPYVIDNDVQKSINVNDNNIFTSSPIFSIGLKLTYTFDVVSKFHKSILGKNIKAEAAISNFVPKKTIVTWVATDNSKEKGVVQEIINNGKVIKLKILVTEGGKNGKIIVKKQEEVEVADPFDKPE